MTLHVRRSQTGATLEHALCTQAWMAFFVSLSVQPLWGVLFAWGRAFTRYSAHADLALFNPAPRSRPRPHSRFASTITKGLHVHL